jgi:hypothetical protein
MIMSDDLIYRLRKRAEIRRNIPHRKSVQNNEPDRIADLLDEAADCIEGMFMQKLDMALDEVADVVKEQRQELKDLGVINENKTG